MVELLKDCVKVGKNNMNINEGDVVTLMYEKNKNRYSLAFTSEEEYNKRDDLFGHPLGRLYRDQKKIDKVFADSSHIFTDSSIRDKIRILRENYNGFTSEW